MSEALSLLPRAAYLKEPISLLLAGLFLALLAQTLAPRYAALSLAIYALALAVWLAGLSRTDDMLPPAAPPQPELMPSLGWLMLGRLYLGMMGLGLGILTYGLAREELHFRPSLLLSWIGSVVCMWLALCLPRSFPLRFSARINALAYGDGLALAVILAVGAALFSRLDHLPDAMTSDHVEYVLDAYRVVSGEYDIYFGNNSGREPLFLYLAAAVSGWSHPTFLALKLVSAGAAFVSLPLLYLVGRQIEDHVTGIMAAGLGAVCTWQLVIGRLGFRVIFAALAAGLLLLFWARALREGRRRDFLLAGLALGAGMYGYSAFRIAPLLVLVGIGLGLLREKGRARRALLINSLILAIIALLVYLPLLAFWVQYPKLYWFRASHLAGESFNLADYWAGLGETLWMFNFGSDPVSLNLPKADVPVLGTVIGAGFLLGVATRLWCCYETRDPLEALPLAGLLIFVLPSALAVSTPLEMPSARRAAAALPLVILLAGGGLAVPLRWLAAQKGKMRYLAAALGAGLLLFHAYGDLHSYFGGYPTNYRARPERAVAFVIRQFLDEGGRLENVYIVYGGGWLDPRAVSIWLRQPEWNNVVGNVDKTTCLPQVDETAPLLALMGYGDEENLAVLRRCYPSHIATTHAFEGYGLFFGFQTKPPE